MNVTTSVHHAERIEISNSKTFKATMDYESFDTRDIKIYNRDGDCIFEVTVFSDDDNVNKLKLEF